MRFENGDNGSNEPIDPEAFQRAFGSGFNSEGGDIPIPYEPTRHDFGTTKDGNGTGAELHIPDPAELAGLFDTLDAFNTAEKETPRLGHDLVDGYRKGDLKDEYQKAGMTAEEAVNSIKNVEGEHAPEAEAALLDLEGISLRHNKTLTNFGISIESDLFDARVKITDAGKFVANLSCIEVENVPPRVKEHVEKIVSEFPSDVWLDVVNSNRTEIEQLDAVPYWMPPQAEDRGADPEEHARVEDTLNHGNALAEQCERLGGDPEKVAALRDLTRYSEENMLVEWALIREMGFDNSPYDLKRDGAMHAVYRFDTDPEWETFWRVVEHAEAKSKPGDTFVADLRDRAAAHIDIFLGTIIATNRRAISEEAFATYYPDNDTLQTAITAAQEEDPYIEKWVARRDRMQSYGHKGEAQQ